MTEAWGQQVIVDNRPGAGGTLGTELGVRAPADGYTFTMISSSYSVNPSLYKLTFDPINDITAVIQLSQGPMLLVVHPSLPAKNVRELIALGRSKPNSLIYASSGHGGITQLATESCYGLIAPRNLPQLQAPDGRSDVHYQVSNYRHLCVA